MCGRFTVNVKKKDIEEEWNLAVPPEFRPRYNVGPGQLIAAAHQKHPKELNWMRWGFNSNRFSSPLINIRFESIGEKSFFNESLQTNRCIIPASSYFEWDTNTRQPYCFVWKTQPIFAFASICFDGKNKMQLPEKQVAVMTYNAAPKIAAIHHRMPIMLTRNQALQWLGCPNPNDIITQFLEENADSDIQFYPVSQRVNSITNDDPSVLIEFNETLF